MLAKTKKSKIAMVCSAFILALLFLFSIFSLSHLRAFAAEITTRVSVESNPVIAIAATPELDFGPIDPTNSGTFVSKPIEALVATNAAKGYELYFSSKDESTNMKNTDPAVSTAISSDFTTSVTESTMPKNSWGYSLNNIDFNAVPKKSVEKQIKNIKSRPTVDELRTFVHLGVKISTDLLAGNYEKSVIFTAVAHANPAKTLHSISTMQQMSTDICSATTTPKKESTTLDTDGSHHGDPNYVPTKTLTDTRDNNTYTVSKLADGKCWMTQNLRIAGKTITSADSDVTSNYTIPASSLSGFDNYNTSNAYVNSDGGFYNWYTATAGTGTTALSTNGQNTTVSICPKGWRLPTGGNNGEFKILHNNYNSPSTLRSSPVNLTLSGNAYSSSMGGQGSYGYYWSSTVYANNYAYYLYLSSSYVLPSDHTNKYYGFSVRCVAR